MLIRQRFLLSYKFFVFLYRRYMSRFCWFRVKHQTIYQFSLYFVVFRLENWTGREHNCFLIDTDHIRLKSYCIYYQVNLLSLQNQIFQTHLKVRWCAKLRIFFWIRKSSNCDIFYSIIFSVYVSRRYYIKDMKCVFAIFLMHTLMEFVRKPISIMFRIKFTFYYLVITTKLCLNYEKRSRNYEKLIS